MILSDWEKRALISTRAHNKELAEYLEALFQPAHKRFDMMRQKGLLGLPPPNITVAPQHERAEHKITALLFAAVPDRVSEQAMSQVDGTAL